MSDTSTESRRGCLGTLVRRQRWGLSSRGWFLCALTAILGAFWLRQTIYPFLAVTERTEPGLLVVEGWMDPNAMRASADEMKAGSYPRVYATGGPVSGSGGYTNDYNTYASVGADTLISIGVPAERVQVVPSHEMGQDRTYSSAVTLREWLREHQVPVERLNVVTMDVHARRSRLLFQRAFGESVKVGVIAVPDPDYDASHWWRSSKGVKDVISEGAAYLYARFLFRSKD